MLDYKKSGKTPIAWITRGGKHIPIFEGDEEIKANKYNVEVGDKIEYYNSAGILETRVIAKIGEKSYWHSASYNPKVLFRESWGTLNNFMEKYRGKIIKKNVKQ